MPYSLSKLYFLIKNYIKVNIKCLKCIVDFLKELLEYGINMHKICYIRNTELLTSVESHAVTALKFDHKNIFSKEHL